MKQIQAAKRYGVSTRTIREWKGRGFPIDDPHALFEALGELRYPPQWYKDECHRRARDTDTLRLLMTAYSTAFECMAAAGFGGEIFPPEIPPTAEQIAGFNREADSAGIPSYADLVLIAGFMSKKDDSETAG